DASTDTSTGEAGETIEDAAPAPCGAGETCIDVDTTATKHTISPLLFGDNVEWFQDADHLWDPASSAPRPEQLAILQTLGITLLRYPGGTLSDFFHWKEAVGPVGARTPQLDPFSSPATTKPTQPPLFAPH